MDQPTPLMYYILFYKTVEQFEEKRLPHRADHFNYIKAFVEKGALVLGGALQDPPNEAVIVFQSENPHTAQDFATNDPYVINGLITSWEVRPWNVMVGAKL